MTVTALTVDGLEAWLRRAAELLVEHAEELTELDAAIGDADHGANMSRGIRAVVLALDAGGLDTPSALLKKTGMTLVSSVGGASGPLYGTLFLRMASSAGDATELGTTALGDALAAGVQGVADRGKATTGEKTMLDAWTPALEAYRAAGDDLAAAVDAGAAAAAQGREDTAPMTATKGRASYLGERSVGHIDPGAASTALLWQALGETAGAESAGAGTAGEEAGR